MSRRIGAQTGGSREARALLDINARAGNGGDYALLPAADQARAKFVLQQEMRTNTFDPETGIILVSDARGRAIAAVGAHYSSLFQGSSPEAQSLREEYAFPLNAMLSAEDAEAVNAFFFWTAWAASTNRPGEDITYTSNWPTSL